MRATEDRRASRRDISSQPDVMSGRSHRAAAAAAATLAAVLIGVVPASTAGAVAHSNGNGKGNGNGAANSAASNAHGNRNGNGNGASSSSGAAASASTAQGSNAGQTPPGNNGHIQIDELVGDGGKGNDPHVSCGFSVSFFGYDAGTQHASITLTPWAPTRGGTSATLAASWTTATRTSGSQLDDNVPVLPSVIASAFAGVAPAHNGYHVRVEVEVTGSQGSDDKFHMLWVAPCASSAANSAAVAAAAQLGSSASTPGSSSSTPGSSASTPASPSTAAAATGAAPAPALTIVKTERVGATGDFVRRPVRATVGEQLQYRMIVADTGNTSLNVTLADSRCDAGTLSPSGPQMVAPGGSVTFTCSHVLVVLPAHGRFVNVAEASGTTPQGASVGPVRSRVLAHVTATELRAKELTPAKAASPVVKAASFTG